MRLCVRLLWVVKYLSKSADCKANISPVSETNAVPLWFAIRRFSQVVFTTLSNLVHNLFFLFPIVLVLIWFLFSMGRSTLHSFASLWFSFTCRASRAREAERRERISWHRKVELIANFSTTMLTIWERKNWKCEFGVLKGRMVTIWERQNERCVFGERESVNSSPISALLSWRHIRLSLSLSHPSQNIPSASALGTITTKRFIDFSETSSRNKIGIGKEELEEKKIGRKKEENLNQEELYRIQGLTLVKEKLSVPAQRQGVHPVGTEETWRMKRRAKMKWPFTEPLTVKTWWLRKPSILGKCVLHSLAAPAPGKLFHFLFFVVFLTGVSYSRKKED